MTEDSFDKFFRKHAEEIRNVLYYRCGSFSWSEDLMQEAFLRLWKNRHKVSDDKALAFIYRVASRLHIDFKRREKVQLKFFQQLKPEPDGHSPEFLAELKEFQELLDEKISKMPEKSRIVFLLSRLDQLTYRQIAERLNLSVKAIEKRMHAALSYLEKELSLPKGRV